LVTLRGVAGFQNNDFMSTVLIVSNQGKIINLKTKALLQQKQKFVSL
jgi:hypothetical protein